MNEAVKKYRSLFSRDFVKELSDIDLAKPLVHICVNWAVIFLSWLIASYVDNFFISIIMIFIVATQLYALKIIGHDAFHLRLSKDVRINNLVADIFVNAPIFTINRLNRSNHMSHHNSLPSKDDPDRHKYNPNLTGHWLDYLFFLSGLKNFSTAFSNVFLPSRDMNKKSDEKLKYNHFDLLLILGWQVTLFFWLDHLFGVAGYIYFWLCPVYMGPYMLNMIRSFAEHAVIESEMPSNSRLISYTPNWIERQIMSPHNMNFHAEHHLWPSIPYYSLPKAHKTFKERLTQEDDVQFRKSYLGFLFEYYMKSKASPIR